MKQMAWLAFLLCAAFTVAQTAADITAEPHHHLLLQNDQVRVFGVTLATTESAYLQHDHNFLLITLDDSELVMWPEGSADVQSFPLPQGQVGFFLGGRAMGLRNDRTLDYRGVVVEFFDPKVTTYGYQYQSGRWGYAGGALNPPGDPHAKFTNRMVMGQSSAADVQLLAGDSFPTQEKPAAELLIPITDLDLRSGSDTHIRKSSGEAVWIGEGRKSELANANGGPARFIMVELRAEPSK